ncbi:MAG: amino acid permease [Gammaproteobacteria bacterium]|nr:amino acid permease [Gammaproteobacteria bacterium]
MKNLFSTDTTAPLNTPLSKSYKIGWISLVALAFGGLNQSLLLFSGLLTSQGTAGLVLLMLGIVVIWCALPGWIELVLMFPNRVGGIAACSAYVFGSYAPTLSCLVGVSYWVAWGSTCAFGVTYSTSALQIYFPNLPAIPFAMILLVAFTALNLTGIKWTAKVMIVSSSVALLLALLAAVLPVITGNVNWLQAIDFHLKSPFPGIFGGFTSIMAGFYLVAFSAPAIENALCFVRETRDPEKNVPKAAYVTAALSGLFYIILPVIWLGVLGPDKLNVDQAGLKTALVPVFLSSIFNAKAAQFAAVVFVLTNSWIYTATGLAGISRALAQIAADGYAPEIFSKVTKSGAPWVALMASFLLAFILTWYGVPNWLLAGTNLSYLLAICAPSVAVLLLRKTNPDDPRPYKASLLTIRLGLAGVIFWVMCTIFGFQQYGLQPVIGGIVFIYAALIFYIWRVALDQKKLGIYLEKKFFHSLHFKLTVAMLFVLSLDAIGYLIAISNIPNTNSSLVVILEDIFILVALLTLGVGLVMPSLIVKSVKDVSNAATQLVHGTLKDFSFAMKALGLGNLDEATIKVDITPVFVNSQDEIGEMANNFNIMQYEIKDAAIGLVNAREGLKVAREKILQHQQSLIELNTTLELRVRERTNDLELTNTILVSEIVERKEAQSREKILKDELIIAARQAGMAEISTSIIHNVGNVLTSINTSAGLLLDITRRHNYIEKLQGIANLIQEHSLTSNDFFTTDEKGKLIPSYLRALAKTIEKENVETTYELNNLRSNLQFVIEIIAKQQSIGQSSILLEEVSINEIVESALNMSNLSDVISIKKDIENLPFLYTDKSKLLQILMNLFLNAQDALLMSDHEIPNKQIFISIRKDKDGKHIEIIIRDNGVGIKAENISKIFSLGFTTKTSGHGFGLHASSISAIELGGSLLAESEGEGFGSTFILKLPYQVSKS